jgi:hypothetical protein
MRSRRLTPPKQVTFWISLLLAVLAVLGRFAGLPVERSRLVLLHS